MRNLRLREDCNHHEQGVVLVMVLWIVTLLSVIATGFIYTLRTETNLASHGVDRARAIALAEAGISYAVIRVMQPDPEKRWPVDGSPQDWRFGTGNVHIGIQDVSGRIDINQANRNLLQDFLEYSGVAQEEVDALLDAIADWRDPDDETHLNGAEENEYLAAGREQGPKNAPFESVEELLQVLGMTSELYQRIKDDLTVFSRQAGINPEAASARVLEAVSDLDPQAVADYIQQRRDNFEQGLPLPPAPDVGSYSARGQGLAYQVSVEARLDTGTLAVVQATLSQHRRQGRAYVVRAWREGK